MLSLKQSLISDGGQRINPRKTAKNGEGTVESPSILFYKTTVHNEGANEPNKQL